MLFFVLFFFFVIIICEDCCYVLSSILPVLQFHFKMFLSTLLALKHVLARWSRANRATTEITFEKMLRVQCAAKKILTTMLVYNEENCPCEIFK